MVYLQIACVKTTVPNWIIIFMLNSLLSRQSFYKEIFPKELYGKSVPFMIYVCLSMVDVSSSTAIIEY